MVTGAAARQGDEDDSLGCGPSSSPGLGVDYNRAFTRLCHLASLTDGKADEAVDDVVVTALVLAERPVPDVLGVVEAVEAFFAVSLDLTLATQSVERLVEAGKALRSKGRISPTAQTTADALERIDSGHQLEARVRDGWLASDEAVANGLDGDLLWKCLRLYMASVFQTHGMLAVELLDPTVESADHDLTAAEAALNDALSDVPPGGADATRRAIQSFFDTPSPERSRYIAQMVDATFTLFAMTLDETAAGYLRKDLPPVDLFLDTNVLFGLLDLDTDARGQSAKELVRFIRDNDFPVTLYYHEATLAEIERTVGGFGSSLRAKGSWPQEVSRAALDRRVLGDLRGVERRYHELNAVTAISPGDFLSKYEHVQELLESWGIRLFRSSGIPQYTTEQKGKLIAEYDAHVKARRPNEPKTYESMDHDVSVWLEVKHRGQVALSSLNAGSLFVTNDLMFRSFITWDQRKRAPRVVLPSQLLQVLRPFGARSGEADERFVATLCLPEFRTAHSGYGDTQRKVLGFLANYADVDTETAVRILANEVLMRRVRDLDVESDDFQTVIESYVLQDNAELVKQQENDAAELARVQSEKDRLALEKDQQIAATSKELAETQQRNAELEAQLGAALTDLTTERSERRARLEAKANLRSERICAAVFLLLTVGLVVAATAGLADAGVFSDSLLGVAGGILGSAAAAIGGWFSLREPRQAVASWLAPKLLHRYLDRIGEPD